VFSRRLPGDLTPNRLSELHARKLVEGADILDLVDSNPTRAELDYPWPELDAALAVAGCGRYDPQPRGLFAAREAVANHVGGRGLETSAERVVLTASTSEAYAFLFKLLCEPGDEVLIPAPSYPLFEQLARAEGVVARPYRLAAARDYALDVDMVEAALTPRSRAVIVVSPNNPTGSVASLEALEELSELALRCELALIGDEVFADYPAGSAAPAPSLLAVPGGLRFSLGGLSKAAGLPQLKLSWIAAGGPQPHLCEALERLEHVADTFLSVGGPVQRALPALLEVGATIRARIRERVDRSRQVTLEMATAVAGARVLPAEGGWHAVLELPARIDEEALCLELLARDSVLVHPGYFYDFDDEACRLVFCLLAQPAKVARAMMAIRRRVAALP
jgi:alanine-synthesizing transaminase